MVRTCWVAWAGTFSSAEPASPGNHSFSLSSPLPPPPPLVPCIRQSPGATVQSGSGPKDREGPGRPWRWARSQAGCPDTRDIGTCNKEAALTEPSLCALRRLGRGEEGVAVVISRPRGLSETMTTSSLQRSEAGRRVMAMLRAQSGHTVGA